MSLNFGLILGALIVGFGAMNSAVAKDHGRHKGHKGGERHMDMMAEELGLSKDQVEKMKTAKRESRKQMKSLKSELHELKSKLMNMMASESTKEQLKEWHSKIRDQKNKLEDLRFSQMLSMRDLLTPEQRKKMAGLHSKMHNDMDDDSDED